MASDITTLGIQIDVSDVQHATRTLNQLSNTAAGTENAVRSLGNTSRASSQGMATIQQGTQHLGSSLLNATRRLLGLRDSMTALQQVSVSVDASFNLIGASATRAGAAFNRLVGTSTLSQMNRITDIFRDTGIAINHSSSQMDHLVARMQQVNRNRAFQQLAQDANLSAFQIARLQASMGDISGSFASISTGIAKFSLPLTIAVTGLGFFAKSCLGAQQELQRLGLAFTAVFGGDAANQLNHIYQQADRLGLKFVDTANAAKGFFAAGKGTSLEKDMQNIFRAVTDAGAALQLSTDEVNGSLLALGQMISKGKVQAEELRGQLGERLPGAFRIAAQAMGMTTAELDKFMADGNLVAEDLLPKFATALQDKFSDAATKAAHTLQGSLNRMENEWTRFKASILESGPVVFAVEFLTKGLKTHNDAAAKEAENARIDEQLKLQGVVPEQTANEEQYLNASGRMVTREIRVFSDRQRDNYRAFEASAKKIVQEHEDALRAEESAQSKWRALYTDTMRDTESTKRKQLEDKRKEIQETAEEAIRVAKLNPLTKADTLTAIETEKMNALALLDEQMTELTKKSGNASKAAAVNQADYRGEIEKTKASIDALQEQLSLDKTETFTQAKIKAEEKYRETIISTNEELAKQVARGSLTSAQAEELRIQKEKEASLQQQLTIKQAQAKQEQRDVQIAQGQVKFYKELATLSGGYSDDLELQRVLIAKQANEYKETYHIAQNLVDEWERLQTMQLSNDWTAGVTRGLTKFTAELQNTGKQWEDMTYSFGKSFISTTRNMFDDFLETGRAKFDSFKNLFKQLLKDIAWQAVAQPIVISMVGALSGALYGGTTATAGTSQATTGVNGTGTGVAGLASIALGAGQSYALGQAGKAFFGGTGLMSGITGSINSAVGNMFPSLFASSTRQAAFNAVSNTMGAAKAGTNAILPTSTFTASLAIPALGAAIGSIASPFVNNMLGLQNNTGSMVGSLAGGVLGTVGGAFAAGALAGSAIPGIGTIVGAGIGALGSLLGGGIGSLFGSSKEKKKPKLEMDLSTSLWRKLGPDIIFGKRQGGASDSSDSYYTAAGAAQGTRGAGAWQEPSSMYLGSIARSTVEQSWAVADSLRQINKTMQEQYLASLEKQGTISHHTILQGTDITQEKIRQFAQDFVKIAQDQMVTALGEVDLKPLTRASGDLAARSVEDMSKAFSNVISYMNQSEVLTDADIKEKFVSNTSSQMQSALQDLDFSALVTPITWFKNDLVTELNKSFADVFTLYDMSETIVDDGLKKSFQSWAQQKIISAFQGIDLSGLQLDFDKSTFAGITKIYTATEAWEKVNKAIDEFLNPVGEVPAAMEAAEKEFDTWIQNLRNLGWQESAIADIEKKRTAYLAEYRRQLEKEMQESLSLRYSSLVYGPNSNEYALQSLLSQQSNEREQWKRQFGENNALYQAGVAIQQAEITQALLNQFKDMRDELLAQEREGKQEEINVRMNAIQEELSAQQKLVNETERLVERFRRFARTLEEYRRDLWSGKDNLSGTRYDAAYSQFNSYLKKALTGDEEAFDNLKSKASELLQLGREQLATREEYRDLFYDVDQKLKQAQLYAENKVVEADKQLQALNTMIESLNNQQSLLQAQLQALDQQTNTQMQSQFTLAEINNAIKYLQNRLNQQTSSVSQVTHTASSSSVNWDQLLRDKAAEFSSYAYRGNTNWTTAQVRQEISSLGMSVEDWFSQLYLTNGNMLGALENTNSTLNYNAQRSYKQADLNTGILNTALEHQIGIISTGNDSLGSLLNTNTSYWPQAISSIGGLNGGLSSIYSGVSGVNTGIYAVNSSIGGLNTGIGSVNSSLGGINNGMSSIYRAIVDLASGDVSGRYGGSTSSYGGSTSSYGGSTTTYNPSTGSYGGTTSGTTSGTKTVPLGTGIYGSTFTSEYDLLVAKARSLNQTNYQGRNNWTPQSTKQYIIDYVLRNYTGVSAASAFEYWYRGAGYYEQQRKMYAKGGITPVNEPFIVGEQGPEIMVSPRQYGVLSNKTSMSLVSDLADAKTSDSSDVLSELRQGFSMLAGYLRQVVVKTDKTAYSCDKTMAIAREWNDIALPGTEELITEIRQGFAAVIESIKPKQAEVV